MKRCFILILAAALCLSGCGKQEKEASAQIFAMDTVMEIAAFGPQAEEAVSETESQIQELEKQLSRTLPDSDVSRINRNGTTPTTGIAAGTWALLEAALEYGDATDGAFDITIAPVMDAWGFTGDNFRVPEQAELDALLRRVSSGEIQMQAESTESVALGEGQAIDLGGIAKGYAGDAVRTVLAELNVTSAVIDLGGDVGLLGAKPDGSDWRIAVKDPADPSKFLGVLTAADTFVVTSGIYERGFEENGVRYHHIIDPKTGKPAESGLVSVTVVCGDGAWADALSTACFVLGEAGSLALRDTLAAEKNLRIELILVTDDGHVRYTAGLAERFEPSEEGTYVYEAIIA